MKLKFPPGKWYARILEKLEALFAEARGDYMFLINKKYVKGNSLTEEAREKILSGELVEGIDWLPYTSPVPKDYEVVRIF